MKNWGSGLIPATLASLSDIRNVSHLAFDGLAGITLPVFNGPHRLPYADRIQYLDTNRFPRYALGFGQWNVIVTPGHTDDSVSLHNGTTRDLICGDLILGDKDGSGHLNRFCWDENLIQRMLQALSSVLSPRTIYPGHGSAIQDDANAFRKVRTFADTAREM